MAGFSNPAISFSSPIFYICSIFFIERLNFVELSLLNFYDSNTKTNAVCDFRCETR